MDAHPLWGLAGVRGRQRSECFDVSVERVAGSHAVTGIVWQERNEVSRTALGTLVGAWKREGQHRAGGLEKLNQQRAHTRNQEGSASFINIMPEVDQRGSVIFRSHCSLGGRSVLYLG